MEGKIITLLSVVNGNGAKYVATNLAFELLQKFKTNKKNIEKKVLLIDFDFDNPVLAYEYVKTDEIHGIDNIINNVSGGGLDNGLFNDNVVKTTLGFDVLRGSKLNEKQKVFTKEIVETIIGYAKNLYDYIFIVVTPKTNNAGTVYSLMNTDSVIVLAKNNYTNYVKMEKVMKIVTHYFGTDRKILMLHNFKNTNSRCDINSKLIDFENVSIIGVLDYDEKTIDNINLEKRVSVFGAKCLNFKTYEKTIALIVSGKGVK